VQAAKGAANISEDPPGGWIDNRDIYLHKIEGMAYGSSKAQGIVRDNRLYHGPLGITLAFPKGWTVENQPDQVVAYTVNKDSYVLMRMSAKPPNLSPREFLMQYAKDVGVVSGQSFTSGDMEGYSAITRGGSVIDSGQGPVRLIALYRGNSVYIFAGASRSYAGGVPEADGLIQSVAQTLRGLKPSEFPLAEPYRIKLLTATAKTKLADYAKGVPLEKYQKEELELLNNMYPGGNPKPGTLFKVVE
jgi:predicted Zn-dependent protease